MTRASLQHPCSGLTARGGGGGVQDLSHLGLGVWGLGADQGAIFWGLPLLLLPNAGLLSSPIGLSWYSRCHKEQPEYCAGMSNLFCRRQ